jgi:hypothetical protein
MISKPTYFYLIYSTKLDSDFFKFSEKFKAEGAELLPVTMDQLTRLLKVAGNQTLYIIASVKSFQDKKDFEAGANKFINLLLKSKRINFFMFSSFTQLNQMAVFHLTKNYAFFKYPILLNQEVPKLIQYYLYKENKKQLWPGGKRAKLEV